MQLIFYVKKILSNF